MSGLSRLEVNQSKITISANKNISAIFYGDAQTSALAVGVCLGLKRHPEYTSLEERLNMGTILGSDISEMADRYIEKYPPGDTSSPSLREWTFMISSHTLSLAKCECLKQLILTNPFIIMLSDDQCIGTDGKTILLHYNITIEMSESRLSALVGNKLAMIQARTTQSQINIRVVSQKGWDAIQETTAKFNTPSFSGRIITHIVEERSDCCTIL